MLFHTVISIFCNTRAAAVFRQRGGGNSSQHILCKCHRDAKQRPGSLSAFWGSECNRNVSPQGCGGSWQQCRCWIKMWTGVNGGIRFSVSNGNVCGGNAQRHSLSTSTLPIFQMMQCTTQTIAEVRAAHYNPLQIIVHMACRPLRARRTRSGALRGYKYLRGTCACAWCWGISKSNCNAKEVINVRTHCHEWRLIILLKR